MKKDRNTFFAESSYMNQANIPNPNLAVGNNPYGMTNFAAANQAFYAGPGNNIPNMPVNYTTTPIQNTNTIDYSDLESRLSKIERQLNRIDARLNKLENTNIYTTEDIDNTNNIYMV